MSKAAKGGSDKLQQKSPAEFFAENKNIAGFDNVRGPQWFNIKLSTCMCGGADSTSCPCLLSCSLASACTQQ
jgi:hypothetical protein